MIAHVDASLYRGSRPQPADFAAIKAQFHSVISLEGLAEDEKEMLELAPVPVIPCTISFKEIYFTGITVDMLDTILEEIDAAPKPLLVHCQHGQDRTGLVIAAYRVRVNHWTKELAWAEAKQMGYRSWPLNIGLSKTWRLFA